MMKNRERIQQALQREIEPFGFRYIKSKKRFMHIVDKNTKVYIEYDADCFYYGFTDVALYAHGEYVDIGRALNEIGKQDGEVKRFGLYSRLQWLIPEGESVNLEFCFQNTDSEETFNKKLERLLHRVNAYLLPYIERLSHEDSAIEEAIVLDRDFLIQEEFAVPVMYCVWKHDKEAALNYLEEKRLRRFGLVEPGEWSAWSE